MKPLDAYLPVYEFSERHRVRVDAPADRIDRALREVTLAELPCSRLLFMLRGLPRRGPVVELIPGLGRVLEDEPGEGLVFGLRGQFWRLRGDDDGGPAAEAVADFRIGAGDLSTETRVHVEDPSARRRFARYWCVIRPFSGLIRLEVLRAARRRAEAG